MGHAELDPNGPIIRTERFRKKTLEKTFARSTIPGGITLTQHVLITRQTNGALPTVNLEKDGCTIGEKSKIKRFMELTPLRHASHAELSAYGCQKKPALKRMDSMESLNRVRLKMAKPAIAWSDPKGPIVD